MSVQSIPFESINLDPSVINLGLTSTQAETSDDGLDPKDFLSQSQTEIGPVPETDQNSSIESLTNSHEKLEENEISDLSLPPFSSSDLLFFSLDNFSDLHPESASLNRLNTQHVVSPVQHLVERQQALLSDMKSAVLLHKEILGDGEDCSEARAGISRLFALLSENALSLQEVYAIEASRSDQALSIFRAWDERRNRTLSRIQGIRSENNVYGAKLRRLLERRTAIDEEIEELKSRLSSLSSNRFVLNKEIGETMSVIESKSSKYVNLFRSLEKAGTDAVRVFLCRDGSSRASPLLKYQSVSNMIPLSYSGNMSDLKPSPSSLKASVICSGNKAGLEKRSIIGVQRCGVPKKEESVIKNLFVSSKDESAYELGYAKASEQLSLAKQKLSALVSNWTQKSANAPQNPTSNTELADVSNMITEKLDVRPITELLKSKSKALEDLVLRTAKISKDFYEQGNAWSELSSSLNAKEQTIRDLFARSSAVSDVEAALIDMFSYLQEKFIGESHVDTSAINNTTNFRTVLVKQELWTVATAIDTLTGRSHYVPLATSLETAMKND